MQGTNLSSSLHTSSISAADNGTAGNSKAYVFSPIEPRTQVTLFLLMTTVAVVGLVGNILVLCFLEAKKKTKSILRTFSFEKNFHVYIKSLAISDVLSVIISVPLLCIHLLFDLLQRGWGCKIARYFTIVFPCVTMYNLLVINIEKYLSTREVPRTFLPSTVKKVVFSAWLAGCLVMLLAGATYDGVRYDLNETHYTVVCRYNNQYLPFRIMFLIFATVQYTIPMAVIITINISLVITVWGRMRRNLDVQRDNGIRMMARAATIRSTYIIIALTFAFIFPYIFFFGKATYDNITKVTIGFETDIILRAVSGLIGMSNPTVNFVLYVVQMKDFRIFIKRLLLSRCCFSQNPNPVGVDNAGLEMQRAS